MATKRVPTRAPRRGHTSSPPLSVSRFDSADYLRSKKDMAEYLEAAIEEGDPALMAHALGVLARAYGMVQLAKDTGLTREGLYKALSEGGNPSLGTVMKVTKALGLKLVARAA